MFEEKLPRSTNSGKESFEHVQVRFKMDHEISPILVRDFPSILSKASSGEPFNVAYRSFDIQTEENIIWFTLIPHDKLEITILLLTATLINLKNLNCISEFRVIS